MAQSGLVLDNPVSGERFAFHLTADDTGGKRLVFDVVIEPDRQVPGAHVHPAQEERFEVVSGEVTFRVDGRRQVVSTGEVVVAPPGSVHAFQNDGEEAHLIAEVRPALDLQEFLESAAGLSRARRITPRGIPRGPRALLQVAVLASHFQRCMYLARPPLAVQRLLLAPVTLIARLLGYRAPKVIAEARSIP
jgi:quercetin dioxygenase-like cupin family protein